jgi:hypothetical protein
MYNLAGFLFANRDLAGAQHWLRELLRMSLDDRQARIALARAEGGRLGQ